MMEAMSAEVTLGEIGNVYREVFRQLEYADSDVIERWGD
jgi:hypothetical protein